MFIKLKACGSITKLRVRVDLIAAYGVNEHDVTEVYMAGDDPNNSGWQVKETPEEIDKLIVQAEKEAVVI